MARTLSSNALRAINARETSQVFLMLLEIDHDTLQQPMRFVANNEDITHQGNVYQNFPFMLALPDDDPDTIPEVQLRIANVDKRIGEVIEDTLERPTCTLKVVLAASPDVIEYGPIELQMVSAEYESIDAVAIIQDDDIMNARIPKDAFIPSTHPGLF